MDGLTCLVIYGLLQLQIQVITIGIVTFGVYKFYKLIKRMVEDITEQCE